MLAVLPSRDDAGAGERGCVDEWEEESPGRVEEEEAAIVGERKADDVVDWIG